MQKSQVDQNVFLILALEKPFTLPLRTSDNNKITRKTQLNNRSERVLPRSYLTFVSIFS